MFRYCICCGDGTGIRFGSLLASVVFVLEEDTDVAMPCFCCAKDCNVRPNMPSEREKNNNRYVPSVLLLHATLTR